MNVKKIFYFLCVIGLSVLPLAMLSYLPTAVAGSNGQIVSRNVPLLAQISYESMVQVQQLADAGYDIWENNLAEQYVVVPLEPAAFEALETAGWQITLRSYPSYSSYSEQNPTQTSTDESGRSQSEHTFYGGYRTVDGIYETLIDRHTSYPTLTQLVDYGDSYCKTQGGCTTLGGETLEGFDLWAIRVTNEAVAGSSMIGETGEITAGEKPVFFLMANLHSREISTAEIALFMLDWLLEGYGTDPDATWLVDHHEVWIIPTANPDGHWIVELGEKPPYNGLPFLQRKNARISGCNSWPPTSSNHYGTDLNRNHTFQWNQGGSSGFNCSPVYYGSGPASEPEIAGVQNLIMGLIPDQRGSNMADAASADTKGILITLHSYSELILWPWGFTTEPAPNQAGLQAIGDKMATYNGYLSCQPSLCLYSASGTTDDWVYGELGIPSFTFELGREFLPTYSTVTGEQWRENGPALRYAAKIAAAPYQLVQGPDVLDVTHVVQGQTVTITATIDDQQNGGQAIAQAAVTLDPPGTAAPTLIPFTAVDGAFDSSTEQVQAIVTLTGVVPSQPFLVYLQGQDSDLNWGPYSAMFVEGIDAPPLTYLYLPWTIYATDEN